MYLKFISILFAIVFIACNNAPKNPSDVVSPAVSDAETDTDTKQTPEVLVGSIDFGTLQKAPYNEYFVFETFNFDDDKIAALKTLSQEVYFTVALGTWCEDSQYLIPRFYALTKALSIDENAIKLIALDEEKVNPEAFIRENNIAYVPTIIVQKNNAELGRIVELTVEDLASDLLKILSGEEYKHTYQD